MGHYHLGGALSLNEWGIYHYGWALSLGWDIYDLMDWAFMAYMGAWGNYGK